MASTLRKEQNLHARALDPDITTLDRGATLGSEGSTAGSESSALDTSPPEYIDITIVLPNGKTQTLTVEYSKQMLDLLVQVTAAVPHLSPTTHTFQALQSGRPVDYQASQPVGTLGVSTLHIVEKPHAKKKHRPAPNQPFEMTQRVTVNLTRQQKMVLRLSPDSPLCEVFRLACQEKGFDPYKYELRHPSQPNTELNMALSLVHYQLSEITLVNIGSDAGSGGRSSTLSLGRSVLNGSHAEQSRDCHTMEKKKKKGLFAVFRKKDKFKPGEARYSGSTSQLPTSSAEAASWSKSPSRGAEGWGKSPSRGAEATKPNYTLHSKSTTSLHSSGADTLQSHPQSRQSHTESRQSHNESRQSHNESRVSHASSSRGGVEESKGQPPPKPPRGGGGKKRQAPPPPPQPASQTTSQRARASQPASQQSPAQVSPTTSSQDSGLVPSEGSHPRPTHSRTSSRSSGFDSAASPLGDSTGLSSDVTGSGARPKTMLKVSTGQKVTNRSKKRHAPPPPPGVSRLRTDSDLASVDSSTSTPRDTPRDQQEVTGVKSSSGSQSDDLIRVRPTQPVFTPPPPPDTPPPDDPPPPPPSDDSELADSITSLLRSRQGQTSEGHGVTDSCTQVNVTARDSLTSVDYDVRRASSLYSDVSPTDSPRHSLAAELVADQYSHRTHRGSHDSSHDRDYSNHESHGSDSCSSLDTIADVSHDFDDVIAFARQTLDFDDITNVAQSAKGAKERKEVSQLTNQIAQLTQDIDQSEEGLQVSPRSVGSQSKASEEDGTDSLENYEFSHSMHEPAQADGIGSSVVLVQSKRIDPLSESQDSGIGTLSKMDKTLSKVDKNVWKVDTHLDKHAESDKISVDSLDTLDNLRGEGGVEGGVFPKGVRAPGGVVSRPGATRLREALSMSEEIDFDQDDVQYVDPNEAKTLGDLAPSPTVTKVSVVTSHRSTDRTTPLSIKIDENTASVHNASKKDSDSSMPPSTKVRYKRVSEEGDSVKKASANKAGRGLTDSEVVRRGAKEVEISQTAESLNEPQTFLIEKPQLSRDIAAVMAEKDHTPVESKGIRVRPNDPITEGSSEQQYSKFMSYVESGQTKSGIQPQHDSLPTSPVSQTIPDEYSKHSSANKNISNVSKNTSNGSKNTSNGSNNISNFSNVSKAPVTSTLSPSPAPPAEIKPTSFFVEFGAPVSSQSMENLSAVRPSRRQHSFNSDRSAVVDRILAARDANRGGQGPNFTITTLEYKRSGAANRHSSGSSDRASFTLDRDGFRVPQGLPPKGLGATRVSPNKSARERERASALRASSMRDIYDLGSFREEYERNKQLRELSGAPDSSRSSTPSIGERLSVTSSVYGYPNQGLLGRGSYVSQSGSLSPGLPMETPTSGIERSDSNRSFVSRGRGGSAERLAQQGNGRSASPSTLAPPRSHAASNATPHRASPTPHTQGGGGAPWGRVRGTFLGPRPWGARHSEPSVRDVRAALAIHEAKQDPDQQHGDSFLAESPHNRHQTGDTQGLGTPQHGGVGSSLRSHAEVAGSSVRSAVTRIGFSPDSQHESDSCLEEKSISMIALPADKKYVARAPLSLRSESLENLAAGEQLPSTSTPARGAPAPSPLRLAKSTENVFATSSAALGAQPGGQPGEQVGAEVGARRSLQNQYAELEQQFSRWQKQLLDNESLLSTETPTSSGKPANRLNSRVSDRSDQSRSEEPNKSANPRSLQSITEAPTSTLDSNNPPASRLYSGVSGSKRHSAAVSSTTKSGVSPSAAAVRSEFNRRLTIDTGDARKSLLEEIERRGRMFEKHFAQYTSTGENCRAVTSSGENSRAVTRVGDNTGVGTTDAAATKRVGLKETHSLDGESSTGHVSTRAGRADRPRYSSLTEGARVDAATSHTGAHNGALASQISRTELNSARARLRQNTSDDTGSKVTDTGSKVTYTESKVTDTGSKVTDTGSKVTNTGSKVTDTGSKVTDIRSKITDTGSKVTDTGSKATDPVNARQSLFQQIQQRGQKLEKHFAQYTSTGEDKLANTRVGDNTGVGKVDASAVKSETSTLHSSPRVISGTSGNQDSKQLTRDTQNTQNLDTSSQNVDTRRMSDERKQGISLELQMFLSRNRDKAFLVRNEQPDMGSKVGARVPVAKETTQEVAPPPEPVVSGKTYGRVARNTEQSRSSLLLSQSTDSLARNYADRFKSSSLIFARAERGATGARDGDVGARGGDVGARGRDVGTRGGDVGAKSERTVGRFVSASSVDIRSYSSVPETSKQARESHTSDRDVITRNQTANLGATSQLDKHRHDVTAKHQSGTRASSPPRQSAPIKTAADRGAPPSALSDPSHNPPPPPLLAAGGKTTTAGSARWGGGAAKKATPTGGKKMNSLARYAQANQLDPREALMIAIRNASNRGLKQVRADQLNTYARALETD